MTMTRAGAEAQVREAVEAMRAGRADAALKLLDQVIASGFVNSQLLLLQCRAAREAGNGPREERVAEALLARDSDNLRGLIVKGDCRAREGDIRTASRFYGRALGLANGAGGPPPDLRGEFERVSRYQEMAAADYRAHLAARMLEPHSRRVDQALSILTGDKQVYLQQPSMFYFPELPQRQFYERDEFPWLTDVEDATADILDELTAVLREDGHFRPYLVSNPDQPPSNVHGLLDNPDWSTLYLWENGERRAAYADRFPRTLTALEAVPLPHIGSRAPAILFSLLKPGARIPAHNGSINTRLICHLPLIIPPNCGLRVGNEVRGWDIGKALIFDDTIEHEAWNDSEEDRIVLIFDVWRPELDQSEREAVVRIFDAVDSYGSA